MGRTPADRPLKVNPKKGPGGGQLACADELAAFLACMMTSRMDAEGACAAPRKALDACAAAAASRTKGRSTINYHLQRLSRALRR